MAVGWRVSLSAILLDQAVELGSGGLIDAGFIDHAQNAHRLQNPQGAEGIRIGGVFGLLEADGNVALRSEVVYLVRLRLLDDADKAGRVCQITMMQVEPHILFMPVPIEMVNSIGIE
jgi:hypothetical protein